MAAEKNAQEIRRLFNQLRRHGKDMSQDEFFGGVVSQSAGGVFLLCFVEGIKIAAIQ